MKTLPVAIYARISQDRAGEERASHVRSKTAATSSPATPTGFSTDATSTSTTTFLWRSLSQFANAIEVFVNARIRLEHVRGPSLDMTDAMGRALGALLAVLAALETPSSTRTSGRKCVTS
jgi:hypothetical protein